MPSGVQLCAVFKAAYYRVLRDAARKDVEDKRRRLRENFRGSN